MYDAHEDTNAGFAAGVITGAIVGAGLALLRAEVWCGVAR